MPASKQAMIAAVRKLRWRENGTLSDRRDDIIRSLASFIRERRLATLTMKDIADRLGVVKGNLYYYFKSKQDILYHCHVKCMSISLSAMEDVQRSDEPSPAARLHELLTRHIRGLTEEVYGAVLLTDIENLAPQQRKHYVAMRDRMEQSVRVLIAEGIQRGEFREQDVALAGFAILGAINWIPKWFSVGGRLSAAEIAEGFSTQLIRSLRP